MKWMRSGRATLPFILCVGLGASCASVSAPWASQDDRGWRTWDLYLAGYRREFGHWPDSDRTVLAKLNKDARSSPLTGGLLGSTWRFERVPLPDEPPDGQRATYDVWVQRDGFPPYRKRMAAELVWHARSTEESYREEYRERPEPRRSTPRPARAEDIDTRAN